MQYKMHSNEAKHHESIANSDKNGSRDELKNAKISKIAEAFVPTRPHTLRYMATGSGLKMSKFRKNENKRLSNEAKNHESIANNDTNCIAVKKSNVNSNTKCFAVKKSHVNSDTKCFAVRKSNVNSDKSTLQSKDPM